MIKTTRICPICEKTYEVKISDLYRGYGKTCSKSCGAKLRERNKKEGKYTTIYKLFKDDIKKEHASELDDVIKIFKHKNLEIRGFEYNDNSYRNHYTAFVNITENIRKEILAFLIRYKENDKMNDPGYWKKKYDGLKSYDEAKKDLHCGEYMGFI